MIKNKITLKLIFELLFIVGLAYIFTLSFQFNKIDIVDSTSQSLNIVSISYPPPQTPTIVNKNENAYPAPGEEKTTPTLTVSEKPTSTPFPTVLENGWYLYEDREIGFAFSYPPNSHFSSGTTKIHPYSMIDIAFIIPNQHTYYGIKIDIRPPRCKITK